MTWVSHVCVLPVIWVVGSRFLLDRVGVLALGGRAVCMKDTCIVLSALMKC